MKKTLLLIVLIYPALLYGQIDTQAGIDWQTFLAKQDPVREKLPQKFDHGAFLGNGLLGTTIFQDGQLLLKTAGQIRSGTLRTDLWNAEVRGEITTDRGDDHREKRGLLF